MRSLIVLYEKIWYDKYIGGMLVKKQRILLVFKGCIKYLMSYRPYMTVWVTIWVVSALIGGIKAKSIGLAVIFLFFAVVPAMIKTLLLAVSRIGGINRYDEKAFGKGPRGRMKNYLIEYIAMNKKI